MIARISLLLLLSAALGGCGGSVDLTCDEVRLYQTATPAAKLRVPEDLDNLEPGKEMPIPEASPRAPRPPGSRCLDMPPTTVGSE